MHQSENKILNDLLDKYETVKALRGRETESDPYCISVQ